MIDELCEEFGLGNKQENRKPHTLKRNRKSACFVQILSSRLVSFSFFTDSRTERIKVFTVLAVARSYV